jgi:erythromycin esterase-like protein
MASHSASYKALRDGQAAIFAEALRNVSIDRKLMLWAHWSHLTYDDSLAGPSVGYALRQRLGERIYTILPVADRGSAIMIFPAPGSDDDVGYGWVRAGSDQFATRMRALSSTPFLVDLRDASVRNDEAFAGSQTVWIESRPVRLSLIRNADAIVWLPQIGPPHVPLPLLMVLGGMHYRKTLAVLAVLLLVAGGSALVWRRRPRPARSSRAA